MGSPDPRPRLGAIRAVTITVENLAAIEAAYTRTLEYEVVQRRSVSRAEARAWGAPASEGKPMLLLRPASGEEVFLRFIQSAAAKGWRALKTFGWNVTEFVVQDVEALADRLRDSAFRVIGAPRGLTRFPMIRAMQALGPAGECCYFTEVGPGSGLILAPALSFVGRVFIVVAAGPDAHRMFQPYHRFDNLKDDPVETPVRVISDAFALHAETPHAHGLVRLAGGTLIELDAYPPQAEERQRPQGDLEPGMAMVSFDCDRLPASSLIAAAAQSELPGAHGLAAVMLGAAGERIELIAHGGSGDLHAEA